jgi:hypothetical protein
MVHQAVGSTLREAMLACPVCSAEYPIVDGVAHFAAGEVPTHDAWDNEALVWRLAAQLGVGEGTQPVVLIGAYGASSVPLSQMVAAPHLLVNTAGAPAALGASRMVVADRLPFGVSTLAAVAVDAGHAAEVMLASAARALRPGGRLVAPAHAIIPAGMRELARDDTEWVAETTTRASGLIELRRRASHEVM